MAASATAPSLAVWQKYSTFPSLPRGYRGQGRHKIPERLLRDAACTRLVWQKCSPFLRCQVATEGRVATESLNGSFEMPPVPVLSLSLHDVAFESSWSLRCSLRTLQVLQFSAMFISPTDSSFEWTLPRLLPFLSLQIRLTSNLVRLLFQ